MSAPRVRGDYEALDQIAKMFGQAATAQKNVFNRLKRQMGVLRGGDWVGKGATAFYAEMDSAVLPSLQRLGNALESAQRVTRQISQITQQAEQDAAACFRLQGAGAVAGMAVGASGAASAASGVANTGATQGEGLSGAATTGIGAVVGAVVGGALGGPVGAALGGAIGGAVGGALDIPGTPGTVPGSDDKSWQQNPLLVSDPNQIFTEKYMRSVVGLQVQGAGDPALNGAMKSLFNDPTGPGAQKALATIAEVRGLPMEQVQADYQKFLQIREQAQQVGGQNGQGAIDPPGGGIFHSDYNSLSQLRFGKVMGDAFGIDPVFGSMLSPTGGLVGPGGHSFDGDSTAVGYHGIIHDAGGYLKNYHDVGPGYDYLGLEGRNTRDPLSGQRAGISYWRGLVGNDTPSVLADVGAEAIGLYDKGVQAWNSIKSLGSRIF